MVELESKAKKEIGNTGQPSSELEKSLIQKEISISTFHRGNKAEIEKKAKDLHLIIDFGYDVIMTSGTPSKINDFITYLYRVESEGKKKLYPKYWDFYEVDAFSKIEIK
mmetsp:Transcript_41285/g.36629  ORF Transcript_41285/g.36629 Transcript_41285/m.36629 type:complete len:109 (+) Transcript_41285:727-1053(+)